MKLTVVFEDHRIESQYANGHVSSIDFYTHHGDQLHGNTTLKTIFEDTVTNAGHKMDDYWAIQYHGGQQEIEYANGHPNQTISSNTGLSDYISLVNTWSVIVKEDTRIASIPTWDTVRSYRDEKLSDSDKIISWSTETGNTVPSEWTTYRQELRDITSTYGANTGNTELIVWPTEPAWPSA
jgi:hypothetical protein